MNKPSAAARSLIIALAALLALPAALLSAAPKEPAQPYKHIVNTGNYHGVYMAKSERASGFIDILGPEDGFCKGELTSVRTRVINKAGKPVVMGTCFTPPVDGGDCGSVGSGGADLASIAGVGFWLLK